MKNQEIKFKDKNHKYSIFIGENNIRRILANEIKSLCPKTKKVAIIIDRNVPNKFKRILVNSLKKYEVFFLSFNASEKSKSLKTVNYYLNKLFLKKLNRNDLIISVGGGITGDVVGFISSVYKRGINLINIPTTLLAQVDSSIGGKTGVNSPFGKNLIGSFYQPKLVLIDTNFLETLSRKQMICGYAEILKHSLIKDKSFFNWIKINTKDILSKKKKQVAHAIKKSCEIKMYFVKKDVNERGLRMTLNFGHTFAHAIEIKNRLSKKISHGEAVLIGMVLAIKLSLLKKVCDSKVLEEVLDIYEKNRLSYLLKSSINAKSIISLIPYLKNDKKNTDDKINFILLKNIGNTTKPNSHKMSLKQISKYSKVIAQY